MQFGYTTIAVSRCAVPDVAGMRHLYQHECHCQVIAYSMVARGLADSWYITVDGEVAGYGAIWNSHYPGRVSEFYVLPVYRSLVNRLFEAFVRCAGPTELAAQSNVPHMLGLLYEYCREITQENALFQYNHHPGLSLSEADLQRNPHDDNEWFLNMDGVTAAKGGILHHYNPPYSDIYMEVVPEFRRKGVGSYLVQQLASECWHMGRIPCARCNIDNNASRRTLERAGLACCGYHLAGRLLPSLVNPTKE